MHLCIIYPLFVCYRLTRWSPTPLSSPRREGGRSYMSKRWRAGCRRISCMFEAMFKRSSLPRSAYLFSLLFLKLRRNETVREQRKEGKNKQRAINKMHIANSLRAFRCLSEMHNVYKSEQRRREDSLNSSEWVRFDGQSEEPQPGQPTQYVAV